MAFVRRKPTEEEVEHFEEFDISCPYGDTSDYEEIVYDEENDFYLFYIFGPGVERALSDVFRRIVA